MNILLESITRASTQLMLKEPFYGHYLSTITKETTDKIATLGVTTEYKGLIKLFVNKIFWNETLTIDEHKYGVLKHETLHIVFKHILMIDQFDYKGIANIAMDMVVNQYIKRKQLPKDSIFIENYPTLALEHGQSVDYYYKKLLHSYKNHSHNKPFFQLQIDIKKHENQSTSHIGSHQRWKALSNVERKMLSNHIDQSIREVVKRVKKNVTYSNLPDALKVYFDKIEKAAKPFVNWRRTLRLFTNSSSRSYLKNTIRRPSRRYGTVPGIKIKQRNKILVAIDTSGSISDKDLVIFFGELHQIYRQGAEVKIVECDTAIQNQYLYKGIIPDFVMGRGGTNFNAPIRFANEEYMPDALIYFTDGLATPPQVSARMPILWLITANGIDEQTWNNFQGRKVKMNDK